MEERNKKAITRKDFLKIAGAGTLAAGAMLTGCKLRSSVSTEGGAIGEVPTDPMTYRTNPHTGDCVSLLGYGCMRFPLKQKADGSGEEVDQETVNELIDYGTHPQSGLVVSRRHRGV
jgi:hypothetical protein